MVFVLQIQIQKKNGLHWIKILYKPVAFNALADEINKVLNMAIIGTNP